VLKQKHQMFVVLLGCADGVVIAAAAYAAWAVRRLVIERSWPQFAWGDTWSFWTQKWLHEPMALIIVPITLYAMLGFGLYRPRRDRGMLAEHGQVIRASLSAIVALIVLVWALGTESVGGWMQTGKHVEVSGMMLDAGHIQLGSLVVILPNLLGLHRLACRWVLRAIRQRGWNQRHVAVIGVGRLGRIACRTLDRNSWTGINVAYFISHHDQNSGPGQCVNRPVVGGLAELESILERQPPDAVYLAIPTSSSASLPGILKRLERFAINVRIIPDVHPRYMPHTMSVGVLEGMPILSVRESPMEGVGGVFKRILDVLGAAAGLMVFGPVMFVIAAVVRLSSPGPVIFQQRRVSLGGETFNIYKFRTMYHAEDELNAPAGLTRRHDPRITPVGRWLRRTSLDELPQLLNVLLGDMSLVGPRPERPELIQRYREDWRGYMLRQHVKAGITGWAQVNGLRGDTSIKKRLQHDLFYIKHWSLGFDLKILWLTMFRGFMHRNAH